MGERLVLGLDFGGTKLAAGIINLTTYQLVDSIFRSTRVEAGAEGAVADMIEMVNELQYANQINEIGVCFGGYAANNQIIKSLHIPGWDQFPIHARLQASFGNVSVYVANDANAVALGEFKYGAGRGALSMLFLTVSTGVGGGVILNGQLWEGMNGICGEIGHVKVIFDHGDLCNCGGYGCVETVSAGPSMVKRARDLLNRQSEVTSVLRDLEVFTARDLDRFASDGDAIAKRIVTESGRYLGIAIGNAVNLLDIDCVVIGGGLSRSGLVWWEAVRAAVDETVLPWRSQVELKASALGKHEGIWGAVALLPDN